MLNSKKESICSYSGSNFNSYSKISPLSITFQPNFSKTLNTLELLITVGPYLEPILLFVSKY